MSLSKKISLWVLGVLVFAFIILVAVRTVHFFNLDKTNAEVAKIHSTKLQLDDVMGKNLPPDPGAEADKTIQGIDANENGIRDDVELAIFKEYPKSAKTRAVLLQYALALQMEFTQTVVNKETVTEVVREQSRAYVCIGSVENADEITDFVKNKEFNTKARIDSRNKFLEQVQSYSPLPQSCDLNLSTL